MSTKLKVYEGLTFHKIRGKMRQVRTIVATTSQKRASRLTGESLYTIRNYWAVTGNENEIAVATPHPGIVFIKIDGWRERNFSKRGTAGECK